MRRALGMSRWSAIWVGLCVLGCEGPPDRPAGPPRVDGGARPDLEPVAGSGRLQLATLDDESTQPLPTRVIISALSPTPAVRFDIDGSGRAVEGEIGIPVAPGVIGAPEGVILATGSGAFRLPAGRYRLFVTHGPEWEAATREITIVRDGRLALELLLRHSVDTRGWIAADMHVHTGRSFDSRLRGDDRVVSEVAAGIELIVATDHNVLTDLQPEVEHLGYQERARALVGDEFNFLEGHGGAYPLSYDAAASDGGATARGLDWPIARLLPAAAMFHRLHALPGRPVVTVNHPRLPPDLGYFTNLKSLGPRGWAPPLPLPEAGQFEAMELMNGYMHAPADLALLLRDWFFLLNRGARVTALGNSDTHRLRGVKAGFPRSWLRVPSDRPSDLGGDELATALRGQRAIASNGPFVRLLVSGVEVGELVRRGEGRVMAHVTVDAPAWIDVDHVRLYVNGRVAWERSLPAGARPRFDGEVALALPEGDSWIAAQADGRQPLPTALIGEQQGGEVLPFAITNPVFVDGDDDGRWQPVIAEPDPGPQQPRPGATTTPPPPRGDDLIALPGTWDPLLAPMTPLDCEPPLWTDPRSFAPGWEER